MRNSAKDSLSRVSPRSPFSMCTTLQGNPLSIRKCVIDSLHDPLRPLVLFVFLVMEVGSRRILHSNVTAHPTSDRTLQQLREAIPGGHDYQFLIHDRDSIFSSDLDELKSSFGLRVLRTPVRAPKANAYCERLIGTVRRECLDFMIPLNEPHLRKTLRLGWLTIIKDAPTPAWALEFLSHRL
jgi:transposase InsO family protein